MTDVAHLLALFGIKNELNIFKSTKTLQIYGSRGNMVMSNEEIFSIDEAENNECYSESTQNSDSPSDESVDEKELLFMVLAI